jgi:hypothetical protein
MTVSLFYFCKLWILHVGTGVRCIKYSSGGYSSTASLGRGVQYCFPMFSACFLLLADGHVPARSITAVKGARVQVSQQEEHMTVFLYLSMKQYYQGTVNQNLTMMKNTETLYTWRI